MFLATSDLHVTDRARDEYRWEIFPWLRMNAENRGVEHVLILGDITDSKDKHSSKLINRLVDELAKFEGIAKVWILRGNHDYVDPNLPYLGFLNRMNPDLVEFITEPRVAKLGKTKALFVPNTKKWRASRWLRRFPLDAGHDFIFAHQTFKTARAANGQKLDGIALSYVSTRATAGARVVSGDIHVPQEIGNVVYCGSPHPIVFGDTFKPRVLFYNGEKLISIPRSTLHKRSLRIRKAESLHLLDLQPGDQIKLQVELPRSEFYRWEKLKEKCLAAAKLLKVECVSIEIVLPRSTKALGTTEDVPAAVSGSPFRTAESALEAYCDHHKLDVGVREAGRKLL